MGHPRCGRGPRWPRRRPKWPAAERGRPPPATDLEGSKNSSCVLLWITVLRGDNTAHDPEEGERCRYLLDAHCRLLVPSPIQSAAALSICREEIGGPGAAMPCSLAIVTAISFRLPDSFVFVVFAVIIAGDEAC